LLQATDWGAGEPALVELRIDPSKTAQEHLAAIFKRAKRMKEGMAIATERLAQATSAREAIRNIVAALDAAGPDGVDVVALSEQARKAAPHDFKPSARSRPAGSPRASAAARPPYRTFLGPSGFRILVGRGATQNDALTTRVARPHDLWLHAKGWAGAHVVVPLSKGDSCPADTLVEAAHLAAHFSDAQGEALVEVAYTPRRYVRKLRGSAPGAVAVDREKVLVLRKRGDLMKILLSGEVDS
jgi:predicted ribosome quality control (RQC) complex YloA/Tae2 family protein